jgi:hypothetical protein
MNGGEDITFLIIENLCNKPFFRDSIEVVRVRFDRRSLHAKTTNDRTNESG